MGLDRRLTNHEQGPATLTSPDGAGIAKTAELTLPGSWQPGNDAVAALGETARPRRPAARQALLGRVALGALLAATGVLYLWDLGASGWANAYYSAAALAGLTGLARVPVRLV